MRQIWQTCTFHSSKLSDRHVRSDVWKFRSNTFTCWLAIAYSPYRFSGSFLFLSSTNAALVITILSTLVISRFLFFSWLLAGMRRWSICWAIHKKIKNSFSEYLFFIIIYLFIIRTCGNLRFTFTCPTLHTVHPHRILSPRRRISVLATTPQKIWFERDYCYRSGRTSYLRHTVGYCK